PLPGRDGGPGRAGDQHLLRVFAAPRAVLALQWQGRRAAGPQEQSRGRAGGALNVAFRGAKGDGDVRTLSVHKETKDELRETAVRGPDRGPAVAGLHR